MTRTIAALTFALTLALSLFAPAAHATTFETSSTYYARVHFTSTAFGKPVAGVFAHIGVFTERADVRGGGTFWNNVQHVQMDRVGDHFEAKIEISGDGGYESQTVKGPIIQYWVYFKDGTMKVTDSVMVPVAGESRFDDNSEGAAKARKAAEAKWDAETEIDHTFATGVTEVHTG
jgi:hypothetical protein